jgi:hypothetical protein
MMTHSVVLLDGETGGFFVADGLIKPIPKLGAGLRRHLLAVNTLAQALEGEADLDSDQAELEALVVQAAYLVLRRLERSAGIEVAEAAAVMSEPEQVAEPHESTEAVVTEPVVNEAAASEVAASEVVVEAAPETTSETTEPEAMAEAAAESTPSAEATGDAEAVVAEAESSEPAHAESAPHSNGENVKQAIEAKAEEAQPVDASAEGEPEKKSDANPEENPQTDHEPIPAAEGEAAHNIEASS